MLNLVSAFMRIRNNDVKLYICGEGDAKEEILELSKLDERIVYKGLVAREEALALQRNAILLVNPRTAEGDYTKYSFPSKIMEYLASGVPTLMYHLPGIPSEYYEYCYTIDKDGIDYLASAIENILNLSEEQRNLKGQSARHFILTKKNPKVQAQKIIDLVECL